MQTCANWKSIVFVSFLFLSFYRTQSSLHWTLCSVKEGTGKESHNHLDSHNITNETTFYKKGIAFHASFEINIPTLGDFERQMEFQANLQSSDSVNPVYHIIVGKQKIKIPRKNLNALSHSLTMMQCYRLGRQHN